MQLHITRLQRLKQFKQPSAELSQLCRAVRSAPRERRDAFRSGVDFHDFSLNEPVPQPCRPSESRA